MTTDKLNPLTGACHPACMLLPEMTADEYRELVEDVRNSGQCRAIVIDDDGLILDGRHRWRACAELALSPKVETFTGTEEEKVALVMSENLHRRHLTTQQRAAIAAELATMKRGTRTDLPSHDAKSAGLSNAQAAKLMGVSEATTERAKKRMREDPAAHAQAKAGTLPRRAPTRSERRRVRDLGAKRAEAFANRHAAEPETVSLIDLSGMAEWFGDEGAEKIAAYLWHYQGPAYCAKMMRVWERWQNTPPTIETRKLTDQEMTRAVNESMARVMGTLKGASAEVAARRCPGAPSEVDGVPAHFGCLNS
jgi:ParB-like chromosome segregation protein Spo0J